MLVRIACHELSVRASMFCEDKCEVVKRKPTFRSWMSLCKKIKQRENIHKQIKSQQRLSSGGEVKWQKENKTKGKDLVVYNCIWSWTCASPARSYLFMSRHHVCQYRGYMNRTWEVCFESTCQSKEATQASRFYSSCIRGRTNVMVLNANAKRMNSLWDLIMCTTASKHVCQPREVRLSWVFQDEKSLRVFVYRGYTNCTWVTIVILSFVQYIELT